MDSVMDALAWGLYNRHCNTCSKRPAEAPSQRPIEKPLPKQTSPLVFLPGAHRGHHQSHGATGSVDAFLFNRRREFFAGNDTKSCVCY